MADKEKQDDYRMDDIRGKDDDKISFLPRRAAAPPPKPKYSAGPGLPIICYCAASILMTVTNKYCLSGRDFNLNFFLLMVQVSQLLVYLANGKILIEDSLLCAFWLSRRANHLVLSRTGTSTLTKPENVCQAAQDSGRRGKG